jgi:tetratricopeptide (TPR) repeat protein
MEYSHKRDLNREQTIGGTTLMLNNLRKWLYGRMALNNMTAGKAGKAESWYKKLEFIDPDSLSVLHNLGVIYISLKKYDEAEKYLFREIELYGESEIRYRVTGDLYYAAGKREKAGKAYGKALSILQNGYGDKSTERFLRRRIKQCKDASLYKKAVEGISYYEEGLALYAKGEYNKAFELYIKAAECDNAGFMALNAAGAVLMNITGDFENARTYFIKALELADIPLIQGNLAVAEHKIREKAEKGER